MTTVALHGAGHMGAGLGWALREGGARVVTCLAGRSPRTAKLVADADLDRLDTLDDVVAAADVVLVVTPPGAARDAAASLAAAVARTGHRPLVADLNAVAPSTVEDLARILDGVRFVDGSISGPPPTVRPVPGSTSAAPTRRTWPPCRGGMSRSSSCRAPSDGPVR